ncbi:MAG: hypothetical protein CK519_01435 [Opitutia bacterium]|nr:MAG: hypothetical protein CK519_01435 [Opitutae bacterium]
MATIGILINHYDARNDIRDLVAEIAQSHRVVLLSKENNINHPLPVGVELRPLVSAYPYKRKFWTRLFSWFGKLPRSRENYYINELFKLGRLSPTQQTFGKIKLNLQMWMPRFMSINQLLPIVSQCDATDISDIDSFLLITEFSDIPMLARICDSGKPAWAYLYSWDHPCKHTVLTDRLTGYLVWNQKLAKDMEELQGISQNKCKIIGATQLCPIVDYLASSTMLPGQGRLEGSPYFYFGCGTGYAPLSRREIRLVAELADLLKKEFPEHLLLVRPYPMFNDDSALAEIKSKSNVRIDDEFRSFQVGRSLRSVDIHKRLDLQRGSACFIHVGTTMGYEAAFLGCPVVFINLIADSNTGGADDTESLATFARQYHVQRYLVGNYPSSANNLSEAMDALKTAVSSPDKLISYNNYVSSKTPLLTMTELTKDILGQLLQK